MKKKIYQTETRPYRPNINTPLLPLRDKHQVIYTIVSVKDRALNAFGRPIFVHTEGQAIRSFQDGINSEDKTNELRNHPEDYDLYLVGTFNDANGTFENTPGGPKQIAIGKQMKIQKD